MIKTLTSWRGIFAVCIVCYHFAMHEFDQMTYAGVTFFFMLSGFLVAYRHSEIKSCKQFYWRRLSRIFPLHWFVLAAMIVFDMALMHKFHYGWDLPLHVLLLQSWVPSEAVFYNYSIHSWFLSSLMFCVIATPLMLKFFNRMGLKIAFQVVIAACVAVIVVNLVADEHWHSYLYVCPVTRLVDYTLGMLLGITLRDRIMPRRISAAQATAHEVVPLMVLAAFIIIHSNGSVVSEQLEHSVLWWLPVSLLLVTCTILNGKEGLVGKFLSIKPLLWLGGISFEVYLLQKFVNNAFCYVVAPFFGHFGILIYGYSFICTLPLLILTAWLVNRLMKCLIPTA
ncbi:MAG: acyltransferase [Muribaculaceae bacterium]|nr:acyltransferase [Muribaculaceae bacterium]